MVRPPGKPRRRWEENIITEFKKYIYQIKRSLGRPRRRGEGSIRMGLKEIGVNSRNWIDLAQDRDYWRALVNASMNLRVSYA